MSELLYDVDNIQLWLGDARCLDMLEPNSVNLIVTSPFYNKGNMSPHDWNPKWYHKIDDKLPEPEYQAQQLEFLKEFYRVTKENGSLLYNHKLRIKDYEAHHPMEWLLKSEWEFVQEIVWKRPGDVNHFNGRLVDTTERIYWFCKGNHPYFNPKCAEWGTVWSIRNETNSKHPCPFPLALPHRCIEAFSREGDLVLDPFVGSGTTMVAARALKRRGIGIDIDRQYIEDSKLRLGQLMEFA